MSRADDVGMQALPPSPAAGEGSRPDHGIGALVALVIASLMFLATPPTAADGGFEWDALYYGARAGLDHPDAEQLRQTAPYCWRVLTPFLVSLLPLSPLDGFRLVAFLSVAATLTLLFQAARDLGLSRSAAIVGVLLYTGIHWTV